jgi:hypothetical protein
MKSNLIGFADSIGNIIIALKPHHLDIKKENQYGFYNKYKYTEFMKSISDGNIKAMCKIIESDHF